MYSIDTSAKSVFVTNSIDDYALVSARHGESIVLHTYAKMGTEIFYEMAKSKVTDFTVEFMEPRSTIGSFRTEYSAVATPGEVKRLHDRIAKLETALQIERYRNARVPLKSEG